MLALKTHLGAAVLAALAGLAAAPARADGDAAKGKATYLAVGCFECHGRSGQGGRFNSPAPPLAQLPMPSEALEGFLRDPSGDMPPYMANQLSKADVADITAFLQALPGKVDPKTIPLLAQ